MYIDPGFGGMLIQIIVALVAAGGAIIFALRKKIKALFTRNKEAAPEVDAGANNVGSVKTDDDVIDMLDEDID